MVQWEGKTTHYKFTYDKLSQNIMKLPSRSLTEGYININCFDAYDALMKIYLVQKITNIKIYQLFTYNNTIWANLVQFCQSW